MDSWFIPIRLIISFLLGAVIGLEREINEKKVMRKGTRPQAVLGLRSFSIITSMGTIIGLLYTDYQGISLLLTAGILILFIVFYGIDTTISKDTGITTELAMIYSFLIGILLAFHLISVQIIIALTVVFILILSRKRNIKDVVDDIRRSELDAFIAFAIIALVILPFLPNKSYSLTDFGGILNSLKTFGINLDRIADINLVNPFSLWFTVALITGVDMVGYVLERTIGQKKGWLLASLAGGFVSSTATSITLAQQSKTSKAYYYLLSAAVIANMASFVQIVLLIVPINTVFAAKLFPSIISMLIVALLISLYFLRTKEKSRSKLRSTFKKGTQHEIFEFGSALRFALMYLTIGIISKIVLEFFGGTAFLFTVAIGAIAGLDAVMINTAQLAGERLDYSLAVLAFIIANAVNLTGKAFYSFLQGRREYSFKFATALAFIVASSLIGLLLI